jgi:hypothetical protein
MAVAYAWDEFDEPVLHPVARRLHRGSQPGWRGCTYLLHIFGVLPNHKVNGQRRQKAMHYIGWTAYQSPSRRIKLHRRGQSQSKYMAEIRKAGLRFYLVRQWPGSTREDERKLKNRKNSASICPWCQRHPSLKRSG